MVEFDYGEMTTRNLGFVTAQEQDQIAKATVFVCGTGGMGGACLQSLARAGIGHVILADADEFEISNLNRQVFATLDTVGVDKTEATRQGLLKINPDIQITLYDTRWPDHLNAILTASDIVVNGMDDIAATVRLYRACQAAGLTLIDAYAAAFPSVYVTRPSDPMPEEWLAYPTRNKAPESWSEADLAACFLSELSHVMSVSSSRHHIDLELAAEMAAGKRSRMSFAPMVILTGNLMAYEVLHRVIGRAGGADYRGYFLNPFKGRTERPLPEPLAGWMRALARSAIGKLMDEGA